jgi:hypothetical protein
MSVNVPFSLSITNYGLVLLRARASRFRLISPSGRFPPFRVDLSSRLFRQKPPDLSITKVRGEVEERSIPNVFVYNHGERYCYLQSLLYFDKS